MHRKSPDILRTTHPAWISISLAAFLPFCVLVVVTYAAVPAVVTGATVCRQVVTLLSTIRGYWHMSYS